VAEPLTRDEATILALPRIARGLPAPPPASLDVYLDAAARCFARYGVQRTSVQDVAQELRVNRTTVYRQVGNVESMVRLLSAREIHRLLAALAQHARQHLTPTDVVELIATAVDFARAHPVVIKIVNDEPELLGLSLPDVPDVLGRVASVIAPLLGAAMVAGELARRDPIVVAEWLARVAVTAVIAPPPGDLRLFLSEILIPALEVRA